MSALVARALPRVRFRKPRPRPPAWWARLAFCLFAGAWAVLAFAYGLPATGAGCALFCASDWRLLARWKPDSLRAPFDTTSLALDGGGFALCMAGLFA